MGQVFDREGYDYYTQFSEVTEDLKNHNNAMSDFIFSKRAALDVFEKFKEFELGRLPRDISVKSMDSDDVENWDEDVSTIDMNEHISLVHIVPHVFCDDNIKSVSARDIVFLFLKFSIEAYRCALLSAFSMKYYNASYVNNFIGEGMFVKREDLEEVEDTGVNDGVDVLMFGENNPFVEYDDTIEMPVRKSVEIDSLQKVVVMSEDESIKGDTSDKIGCDIKSRGVLPLLLIACGAIIIIVAVLSMFLH